MIWLFLFLFYIVYVVIDFGRVSRMVRRLDLEYFLEVDLIEVGERIFRFGG